MSQFVQPRVWTDQSKHPPPLRSLSHGASHSPAFTPATGCLPGFCPYCAPQLESLPPVSFPPSMASDKPPKPLTLLRLCQPGQVDAWGLPGSPPGYECLPQFKKCVSLQLEFQAALLGLMHHWRLCKSLQRGRQRVRTKALASDCPGCHDSARSHSLCGLRQGTCLLGSPISSSATWGP